MEILYKANDGEIFNNMEDCKIYEEALSSNYSKQTKKLITTAITRLSNFCDNERVCETCPLFSEACGCSLQFFPPNEWTVPFQLDPDK